MTLIPLICGAVLFLVLRSIACRLDPVPRALLDRMAPSPRPRPDPANLLERIGRGSLAHRIARPELLKRRLELAGQPLAAEAVGGLEVVLAVGGGAIIIPLITKVPLAALLIPVAALMGLRAPSLVLARMGKRRQQRIAVHVPDLVEVLAATTEAGMSPLVAFRRSAEVMPGPLGIELKECTRLIDLGMPWRRALDDLVQRTDVASLRKVVGALARSHRLGTSVRSALRTVADDLRADRRSRAEELARRAPVKMLFPLVFLILPAFLLLTVGPVVLATIRSLH